jgi:hypothetical protein
VSVRVIPGSVAIEPASLTQVITGARGEAIVIPDDAGNVARDLRALDPTLRVRYSVRGGHYVIYQQIEEPGGRVVEHFVTTAMQLDQRIVRRVEALVQPDHDAGAALEATLREKRARRADAFRERVAGHGDQLAHALRRDLGVRDRIAVP